MQTCTHLPQDALSFSLPHCRVDLHGRNIIRDGRVIPLTATEAALLQYLVEQVGRVVPMTELLVNVWGYSPLSRTRTVYANICFLRNKLETDPRNPRHVRTARGHGYWFNMDLENRLPIVRAA